uniref:tRNA (N(6)-L-threonylcarbamoyladenosine(37)-C(2))- methylthiotransferase MtaB n=1 Tax=Desulforadius tongensis TaxID=1216062 RepID=UPI00195770F8|nr:tRNA (N(6)-L-threonylcarbamoyladenosine(37)-C(2))-methylthiotransferase MtaB [Desulforadius tongensis]
MNNKYCHDYSYKIITLGCPVNQAESASLDAAMQEAGYRAVESNADIYIINSCAVTKSAARKSRYEVRHAKKENPRALIVLAGCYAQVDAGEIKEIIPEADVVIGTAGRSRIPQIITEELQYKKPGKRILVQKLHRDEEYEEMSITSRFPRCRPVVKIQEGCDEFCSYCVVVHARGKPRSRDPRRVIEEVLRLAEAGHKEIVLAGTHLGAYGRDLGRTSLPDLLSRLDDLKYPFRIRLSSIEPMVVSTELLETMAEIDRVCNNLYLPLQSGSSSILKKMKRRYTVEQFAEIICQARELMPDISIISDMIVGFPGEKETDHMQSMETVRGLALSKLHVFPYSPREKTPAARYPEQVRPDVKKRRVEEMHSLGEALALNFHRRFIGSELRVLVERIKEQQDGVWAEGFSDNYILTRFPIRKIQIKEGDMIAVKPEKAYSWGVKGIVID